MSHHTATRTVMNHHPASRRTRTVTAETLSATTCFLAAALLLLLASSIAGCGPTFDSPSLIESTRVVGARVEVAGAPRRASPAPGERATVTWLMAAPGAMPALGWAFALCAPGAPGGLSCESAPLALVQGTENPPRVTVDVPSADALGGAQSLILYGRICVGGAPVFDPRRGEPACAGGAEGTTASVAIGVQTAGADANHNPVAEHGLTLDGQPWPAVAAGAESASDPCLTGPRVLAGTEDHLIAAGTGDDDRERYTALFGDPPMPTAFRESLQLSYFTTGGKFNSPYSFVEGDTPPGEAPVATVKWTSPKAKDLTGDTAVSFLFVVRDSRGGMDWTARAVCVAAQ